MVYIIFLSCGFILITHARLKDAPRSLPPRRPCFRPPGFKSKLQKLFSCVLLQGHEMRCWRIRRKSFWGLFPPRQTWGVRTQVRSLRLWRSPDSSVWSLETAATCLTLNLLDVTSFLLLLLLLFLFLSCELNTVSKPWFKKQKKQKQNSTIGVTAKIFTN